MWPFAFTTAAIACACGPMMAMDLSGPAAKDRPITRASQPQTTSATLPAIRSATRSRPSVIVEVLNSGAPGFQVFGDLDQMVDPNLQARPAEAGFCVELEREQFGGVLDVKLGGIRRDHGDHDLAVPRDLCQGNAAIEQAEHDFGEI